MCFNGPSPVTSNTRILARCWPWDLVAKSTRLANWWTRLTRTVSDATVQATMPPAGATSDATPTACRMPATPTIVIQDVGGGKAAVQRGIEEVKRLLPLANDAERVPLPLSKLTVALQCGGSDGYSGITANPALGHAADMLVRHGGSVILAETPECHGAEHLLAQRATSPDLVEKLLNRMAWWQTYAAEAGAALDNNPSPGNRAGGITTILEKSLGAVAKSGSSPLVGVLDYASPVKTTGFNFMDSPGYDPVSVTGQIAAGANVVCFTTGRGSVYGSVPVPTLKLASNTKLFERMPGDMDINCGTVAASEVGICEDVMACGRRIFEGIIRTASGQQTQSERFGFGEAEFAAWSLGAVL